MYKVRFHLAQGPNFQKWQIRSKNSVRYIDPKKLSLIMWQCRLVNRPTTAKKIHEGANKTVCAWIVCKDFQICDTISMPSGWLQAKFNPKECTHWYIEDHPTINIDGFNSPLIYTYDRKVYVKELGLVLP
jgi:hypothetical protein